MKILVFSYPWQYLIFDLCNLSHSARFDFLKSIYDINTYFLMSNHIKNIFHVIHISSI